MVTAEITLSRERLVTLTEPMQLVGIDWATYADISEELGESSPLNLTYNKGTLTFMPTSKLHEMAIGLLQSLLTLTGVFLRVNIVPTGSATMRSISRRIGVEPDLSYFVKTADAVRITDSVEDELPTPPDIVVEVDIHHRSNEKFEIYSELGISEFWQYDGQILRMFRLNAESVYEPISHSGQIPILSAEVLSDFLRRGQEAKVQFELLNEFQNWLMETKQR